MIEHLETLDERIQAQLEALTRPPRRRPGGGEEARTARVPSARRREASERSATGRPACRKRRVEVSPRSPSTAFSPPPRSGPSISPTAATAGRRASSPGSRDAGLVELLQTAPRPPRGSGTSPSAGCGWRGRPALWTATPRLLGAERGGRSASSAHARGQRLRRSASCGRPGSGAMSSAASPGATRWPIGSSRAAAGDGGR